MSQLVPVVDLADPAAPSWLDDACTRVGFFQVTGHGISEDTVEAMLEASGRFFDLPEPTKRTCIPPRPDVNRGWAPLGTESLAYSLGVDAPPDLFEAFNVATEHDEQNIWPALDDFRRPVADYFGAVADLAQRLTLVMAEALGMDRDFFVPFTDRSPDVLRINWYRRGPDAPAPLPGQQRMGAHTDYGVLTVLHADPVPGLEIVGPDGDWVGVRPEPGCFLVNLGDLLAQWTNDRWRSTLHRVAPPGGEGRHLRRSAAFFHEANSDALVEAIPSCVTPDRPARYPPVLAGEHLLAKLLGPREGRVSVATSTIADRTL